MTCIDRNGRGPVHGCIFILYVQKRSEIPTYSFWLYNLWVCSLYSSVYQAIAPDALIFFAGTTWDRFLSLLSQQSLYNLYTILYYIILSLLPIPGLHLTTLTEWRLLLEPTSINIPPFVTFVFPCSSSPLLSTAWVPLQSQMFEIRHWPHYRSAAFGFWTCPWRASFLDESVL